MHSEDIKEQLQLKPHPEGGFYRETYRGGTSVKLADGKTRRTATAIYYLLEDSDKSHFHKVSADELWLFHQGEPLEILVIQEDGSLSTQVLGNRLAAGEVPQFVVPADTWFAARLKQESGFALVSCVVAPGFEFDDFELADSQQLKNRYPQLATVIDQFTL